MELSIIVPIFNEAERLSHSLPRLAECARQRGGIELVLVDDGSTDGSMDLIQDFQRNQTDIIIRPLRYEPNHGKGFAVRQGMLEAEGNFRLFCDADLATPLYEIERLLPYLEETEVVIGSRAVSQAKILKSQPLYRTLGGKGLNLFIRALATPGIHDTQCGFKLFTRQAAEDIFSRTTLNGFSFDVEALFIARLLGHEPKEVAISWSDVEGSKVQPVRDALRILRDLLIIRKNAWSGRYN